MASSDSIRLWMMELEDSLSRANQAREQGRNAEAAALFQRAARALLQLAGISSDPALKKQRFEQAMRLREQAEALAQAGGGASSASEPAPRGAMAADDDDEMLFAPEVLSTPIGFDQVGGLDAVKQEIRLRMILPFEHPEQARHFSVAPGGGLLLYGPPGTGKTLIARATAGELGVPFFNIRASDVVGKWFGEAEKKIRALFETLSRYEKAVLFIDEIDALVPDRSRNRSSVMARVVPQFLTEMDGFKRGNNSLLIIGATNEPWALDPAVLRPGRFDVKVYVGLPDFEARQEIIRHHLHDRPLADDVDLSALATAAEGLTGADIAEALNRAARQAFENSLKGGANVLRQDDLQTRLEQAASSVTQKQIDRYRKWKMGV